MIVSQRTPQPKQRTRRWTVEKRRAVADQVYHLWDLESAWNRALGRIYWTVDHRHGNFIVSLEIRDIVHRQTIRIDRLWFKTEADVARELLRCKGQLEAAVAR